MFEPFGGGGGGGGAGAAPDWITQSGRSGGFVADRRFGPSDRRESEHDAGQAQDDAIATARAEGEAIGRAAAEEELAAEAAAHGKLQAALVALDDAAQETLSARLAETVALLCERSLEPLALDHSLLAGRCRRAVKLLGEASGALTLHLHPDDIPALDPGFAAKLAIEAEPTFERGSLRLEGLEGSVLDGPDQWRAAIAAALGSD